MRHSRFLFAISLAYYVDMLPPGADLDAAVHIPQPAGTAV
jgi:hypothetical protein